MRASGEFEAMPKKEALLLTRELEKLERNLNGIRDLERLPDAVFILDTKKEDIAVTEANKLAIPVVAVVDTNCDPDVIQYVIPGNDDAIRSGDLLTRVISDAVLEGRLMRSKTHPESAPRERSPEEQADKAAEQARAAAEAREAAAAREARVLAAKDAAPADAAPAEAAPAEAAPAEAATEAADAESQES